MMLFMLVVSAGVLSLLLLMAAWRPVHAALSLYELRRRQAAGDANAMQILRREGLMAQLEALREPIAALLLVGLTLLLVAVLGWLWGAVAAAVIALFYSRVGSMSLARRHAQKLYAAHEDVVLKMAEKYKKWIGFLTGKTQPDVTETPLGSPEELLHLITESGKVLSPEDKKLLSHALVFTKRRANEIMTARDDIIAVEHTELLGPLVLSDLHKTGHSCFPVTVGDLNHVVGMLDIRGHLTLEAKRSVTAAKAMVPHAFYLRGDQTLDHALAAFVRTRHHLLLVIDEEGATIGLLSLRDVLETLFGRPMADEFASDGDVRIVAKRHV